MGSYKFKHIVINHLCANILLGIDALVKAINVGEVSVKVYTKEEKSSFGLSLTNGNHFKLTLSGFGNRKISKSHYYYKKSFSLL